jgi:hypothetical protein
MDPPGAKPPADFLRLQRITNATAKILAIPEVYVHDPS